MLLEGIVQREENIRNGIVKAISVDNSKRKPNEDYFSFSLKHPIFAVADGVSRSINPEESYPNPSGARLAAEEFCKVTIEYLEEPFYSRISEALIRGAMGIANARIRQLNDEYDIPYKLDYWTNDYFCTCGIVVAIKGNVLYYGCLGDCGLIVFNRYDFPRFISVNDVEPLEVIRDGLNFCSEKERMIFWRQYLRNKPSENFLTYGVFTGEPEALHYCHIGKLELQEGDSVFLYSDGFSRFLRLQEFRCLFQMLDGAELDQRIRELVETEIKKRNDDSLHDDKALIFYKSLVDANRVQNSGPVLFSKTNVN